MQSIPKTGRKMQVSLRTWLMIVAIICVGLALFAARLQYARRQAAAATNLAPRPGIGFFYSFELDGNKFLDHPQKRHQLLRSIVGDHFFTNVEHIHCLNMHGNTVQLDREALLNLGKLTTLREADLSGAEFCVEEFPQIAKLQQLKVLEIDWTKITDRELATVGQLQNLEQLHLNDTRITSAGLKHLKQLSKLKTLDLRRTPLDDAAVDSLCALPALKTLKIQETNISKQGVERIRKRFGEITVYVNN